jgi:hypothetical protein
MIRIEALIHGHPGWESAFKSFNSVTKLAEVEEVSERVKQLGDTGQLEELDADQFKEMIALLELNNAALRRLRPPSLAATRALHAEAHKVALAKPPSANSGSLKRLLNNSQLTRLRLEAERADLAAVIYELDRTLVKSRKKGSG